MLESERRIKFFAKMDRKYFLAEIRRSAEKIAEIREIYPDWMVNFEPKFIASIDERVKKTGAQFYKDLRVWADDYVSAAQAAAVKLLPQA